MKLPRARRPVRGRIEIIPMIDVMFFLLATFMLASLSMQRLAGLPIDLPRGDAPTQGADRRPLTLTVTHDGRLLVDDAVVPAGQLAAVLRPRLAGANTRLVVNADARAPHGTVAEAMLVAREAGAERLVIAIRRDGR